jgi:predicted Zn-dependent protease
MIRITESGTNAAADRELYLLESLVKLQPKDARVQSGLAILYARRQLRDKALLRIHSALAMSSDDSWVFIDVAEAYEALGDRRNAIAFVEEGLKRGYDFDDVKNIPWLVPVLDDPDFHAPDG